MFASGTSKACWPPQLKKILSARSIIRKPSLNFSQSAWILLRISVIGIYGGGGVAAKVVETDPAIHRFVGIAAYYDDVGQKRAMIGDRFEEQVAAAKAQWAEYEKSGKIATIAMVSDDAKIGCAMRQQPGTENEPFAYYGTARGASPNYTNRFALMSLADLLTFDSMAGASRIKAPTLIVHGTIDAYCTPENARQFYDALSTRKAYREIPTTNHIELYDDENRVNQAVAFANEWLSDQP